MILSQATERTFLQIQPLLPLFDWWHWLVLMLVIAGLAAFVFAMYRRDTQQLPAGLTVMLTSLRLLAIAGIVLFVLNPQLRSETKIVKTSRLPVLVDTSLSMGLKDRVAGLGANIDQPRRIDEVIQSLANQSTLQKLREQHDLSIYRFGDSTAPELIATLPKRPTDDNGSNLLQQDIVSAPRSRQKAELDTARFVGSIALTIGLMAIITMIGWFVLWLNRRSAIAAWGLCLAVFLSVATVAGLAGADLLAPSFDLQTSLGWKEAQLTGESRNPQNKEPTDTPSEIEVDWQTELSPNGTSTRLGSAIQSIVNRERGGPIAGVVVITDGRSNAGVEPSRAIAAASNGSIPIFSVGVGSNEAPKNVQVADIQAPPRVFPGDKFRIKGLIQSFGLAGKSVRVDLISVDEAGKEAELIEAETTVRLPEDGETAPIEFEIARQEQGKRRYTIRTAEIEGDLDPRDNERGATVEIIERKTVVLLMAGGPSREFRFLRNQLYRDKDITLHVWLQSAKQGADQESDILLQEFPQTRDGVFQYDCIIAFDPDWRYLDANQADLLERWVAEKAGGILTVAGPVNTPEWTRRPRGDETIDKIRRLYPVSFYSQGSASLKLGRFGGDRSFPLEFTREGRAAEFLWAGDTAAESKKTWQEFEGVFGYYAVNEAKSGADILAYFSDPTTAVGDRLPIYLASHYYGAGRVFFQASGEMWRVRRLDVDYFEQYYSKLIRWLSQGRLLRDSTRGVLLTDRERCWMGDQVTIQAILTDAQDQPLQTKQVRVSMTQPNGKTKDLMLESTRDSVRAGTYSATFPANLEGEYRLALPIPDSPDLEMLSTSVQVNIPDLEKERPQRNDSLLQEIAEKTSGHYFVGMKQWDVAADDALSPVQLIQGQDQATFLPGTPNRIFQQKLMAWLLGLLTMVFAIEWTCRRLNKLA